MAFTELSPFYKVWLFGLCDLGFALSNMSTCPPNDLEAEISSDSPYSADKIEIDLTWLSSVIEPYFPIKVNSG
jgi:hypothetical protein